jgi:hypothetical protein
LEQLTYIQSRKFVSEAPGTYTPIQSVVVGAVMALHVNVNVLPTTAVVVLIAKFAGVIS